MIRDCSTPSPASTSSGRPRRSSGSSPASSRRRRSPGTSPSPTDLLGTSKINVYVPVLVHRFARERLKALGQAEGAIVKEQPEVLFVCVHNAGRWQMAAGS